MKFRILVFILALGFGFTNHCIAQKLHLYNSKFQLIADTNHQLSESEFKEWSYLEKHFLYDMATQYDLPDIITVNRIGLRGIFEFKYSADSGFYGVQFHPDDFMQRDLGLIKKFIIPSFEDFLSLFEKGHPWLIGKMDIDQAVFYLPFSFKTK